MLQIKFYLLLVKNKNKSDQYCTIYKVNDCKIKKTNYNSNFSTIFLNLLNKDYFF